jgi:GNAT superfamily N-acetyltransferase
MSLLYDQASAGRQQVSIVHGSTSPPVGVREWLCAGPYCWRLRSTTLKLIANLLFETASTVNSHVHVTRWIRYRTRLADASSKTADPPTLISVTDHIIQKLRNHPDCRHNQLQSGLRFWDHGLRRAYLWWGAEGPLCIQWLLTEADNEKLRSLPIWAGMYPPLAPGCAQVENLFALSNVRRRGVATQFAYGMYEKAREHGLRELITHIHESNVAACGWAARTGWNAYGTITQYQFAWPALRGRSVFLHSHHVPHLSSSVSQEAGVHARG